MRRWGQIDHIRNRDCSVKTFSKKGEMKITLAFLIIILGIFHLQWLNAEFMIGVFEPHISYYLNVTSLDKIFVDDRMDCSFACMQNVLCVSFNVAVFHDDKGKRWCELLSLTSYINTTKLLADHRSHHFTMKVICDMSTGAFSFVSRSALSLALTEKKP